MDWLGILGQQQQQMGGGYGVQQALGQRLRELEMGQQGIGEMGTSGLFDFMQTNQQPVLNQMMQPQIINMGGGGYGGGLDMSGFNQSLADLMAAVGGMISAPGIPGPVGPAGAAGAPGAPGRMDPYTPIPTSGGGGGTRAPSAPAWSPNPVGAFGQAGSYSVPTTGSAFGGFTGGGAWGNYGGSTGGFTGAGSSTGGFTGAGSSTGGWT